jgi:hypothetical protein
MSEYQRIAFRAIDKPVSEKNLEYMRRQSSRAEITPWSFDNEYHFGDFGGNADEMLRRGYDLHLHYANFGIRKLLIRLPQGLPDPNAVKPYLGEERLQLLPDNKGPGAILALEPYHEPGDLEDLWEFDDILERLAPLRGEILDGDLRPFYLAHLAVACDGEHNPEETKEAPVPAGLEALSKAQAALAELYGLSEHLVAAAAQESPPLPRRGDPREARTAWLVSKPVATKDRWLAQLMADAHSTVRGEILAEFRKSCGAPTWPTVRRNRTIAELEAERDRLAREASAKAAALAARKKAERLAKMAADPQPTLRETEKLVEERSTEAYEQIATLLSELRLALAGTAQADLADRQARELKTKNPTLRMLTSELRRQGFLPK